MSFGCTTKEMMKEIQSIHTNNSNLLSVYGFGSYFRNTHANDCDLLLVVKNDAPNLGRVHAALSKEFLELGIKLSINFDLTILTEREHNTSPLREHDRLVSIIDK
ncbi:MAG: hypothetical protein CMF18_12765 [Idiomarinaceae bacterium]|nr:hypothetical protein [Idiomarinaceae bacterium]